MLDPNSRVCKRSVVRRAIYDRQVQGLFKRANPNAHTCDTDANPTSSNPHPDSTSSYAVANPAQADAYSAA